MVSRQVSQGCPLKGPLTGSGCIIIHTHDTSMIHAISLQLDKLPNLLTLCERDRDRQSSPRLVHSRVHKMNRDM